VVTEDGEDNLKERVKNEKVVSRTIKRRNAVL
jgi:hypothetical protein